MRVRTWVQGKNVRVHACVGECVFIRAQASACSYVREQEDVFTPRIGGRASVCVHT